MSDLPCAKAVAQTSTKNKTCFSWPTLLSVRDIVSRALRSHRNVDLFPSLMRRMVRILVECRLIFELHGKRRVIAPALIFLLVPDTLHLRGFDPNILDARNLGSHVLHAVNRCRLLLRCSICLPHHG